MKDVHGIQRGKCHSHSCECEEYIAPSTSGKLRCEYCNHTPVDHDKIVKLGKCNKCGDCEAYESEDKNSCSDCQYCGCSSTDHEGAEKLKLVLAATVENAPLNPLATGPIPGMAETPGVQLRTDDQGQPVQTTVFGNCNYPGCSYPKRIEKGAVLDFCSRTCATKYAEMVRRTEWQSVTNNAMDGGPPNLIHPGSAVQPVLHALVPPPPLPPQTDDVDQRPPDESGSDSDN